MSNLGFQSLWKTGSRFYFQRDPITIAGSSVTQPILDFGTMTEPTSPAMSPTPVTLEDSDGGILHVVAEEVTKMEEMYEAKFSNLNMDNLSLAFCAQPPVMYDPDGGSVGDPDGGGTGQPATAVVGIQHYAAPGRLVKIQDAGGNPVFGITSIQNMNFSTGSGTAMTQYNPAAGTGDWQWVSQERGIIRIVPTSTVMTAPGPIFISYTPRAITGLRTIYPQTQTCTSTGLGILIFGRCNNGEQSARVGRFSVTPTTNVFAATKYSEISFRLRPLYDPTLATAPAGHFSYWLGNMPSLS